MSRSPDALLQTLSRTLPVILGTIGALVPALAHAHGQNLPGLEVMRVDWEGLGFRDLCLSSVSLDALFSLGPHGAEQSVSCSGLRGVGFALLALVALVVIALGRMRLQTENKRLDLAQRLVEQGIDPPPGLLMGPARADLRRGVVLMFAGLGLFAAGALTGDRGLAAGSLVPEFIGLGYLLSFRLASRPSASSGGRAQEGTPRR